MRHRRRARAPALEGWGEPAVESAREPSPPQVVESRPVPPRVDRRRVPTMAAVGFLGAVLAAALVLGRGARTDVEELRRDASEALGAGDCRSAADSLAAILERDTQDVEARKTLAACYRRTGRYSDAERQLVRAVQQDPSAGTYLELANTRLSLGLRVASWQAIEAAADAATTSDQITQASGMARTAGNPALAKAILDRVEPARRDDRWLAEYAASAAHAGDPDYRDRYQQAIDAAPDGRRPGLIVEMADALRERGRLEDALAAYLAVADDAPAVDQRHRNTQIGDLQLLLNRPADAVSAYKAALGEGAADDTTRLRVSLARALVKAGMGDRARSVLDDVLRVEDVDPSTRAEAEALRLSLA